MNQRVAKSRDFTRLQAFLQTAVITELLLKLPPENIESTPEVCCAVVGNVDSGKSTTLGVLTRGGLDDGRGKARVGLFRHKHEIETGRTSSVVMEVGILLCDVFIH